MNENYDLFISYRRLDEYGNISGRDQARAIAKQLIIEGYNPFFDYSEIKDGYFDEVIIPAIKSCKYFILVLTKDSLNRCKQSGDWVRREIETALNSGCGIINVSPDNSFNGWPEDLPDSISAIKTNQITPIYMDSMFESCVKILIDERIKKLPVSYKQVEMVHDKLYQYASEYDDLMRQATENNDVEAFKKSAEAINKIVQLYRQTHGYYNPKDKASMDSLLNIAESKNDLSSLIAFIQEFHKVVENMMKR